MKQKARLKAIQKAMDTGEGQPADNPFLRMPLPEFIAKARARIAEAKAIPEAERSEGDLYVLSFDERIEATAQRLAEGENK